MDLTPYLESLRRDLTAAAGPGGSDMTRAADLLAGSLDASARLYLMEALSDAAEEITAKLGSATVEVRLRGREAELVVADLAVSAPMAEAPPVDGGDVARITLRLPEALKEDVERAATDAGVSANSWLVRAIKTALYGGTPAAQPRGLGNRVTGFAQA
jgi:hypothetical protein